jgi:hypothetical protein
MKKFVAAVGLFFLACLPTLAQDKRAQLFFGYSYARIHPNTSSQPSFNLNGESTSFAYDLTDALALVADFGISHITKIGDANADVNFFSFLFGPRFSYRRHARVTPFGHLLIGGVSTTLGAGGHPVPLWARPSGRVRHDPACGRACEDERASGLSPHPGRVLDPLPRTLG